MSMVGHFLRLELGFKSLLSDLAPTWSKQDLEYIGDLVSHREYGEALGNLVALGRGGKHRFSDNQTQQIRSLAAAMSMRLTPDMHVVDDEAPEHNASQELR